MTRLEESTIVNRSIDDVYHYLSRFENIRDWDPGVADAQKRTPGKPAVGTEYEVIVQFGMSKIPTIYVIDELVENKKIQLTGTSDNMVAKDTIILESLSQNQTLIKYIAELTFTGLMQTLEGVMQGVLKNVGTKAINGIKAALDPHLHEPSLSLGSKIGDAMIIPGMLSFSSWGFSSRKRKFTPITENLTGKTAIITGASTGLGRYTAIALARLGAKIVIVARSADKLKTLKNEIEIDSGNTDVSIFSCDLSNLKATRTLAKEIQKKHKVIDILVNNAGALFNERKLTEEGNEMSLSLLLLSPFVLTESLLPALKKSGAARVVNVSSGGMYSTGIKVNDLQFEDEKYNGSLAYARAKRGLVMISEIWAKRFQADRISVNSMHPGWADTPGVENALPGFYKLTHFFLRTPEQGADTMIYLAASREAANVSGLFFLDREPHSTSLLPATKPEPQDYIELEKKLRELTSLR